MFPRPRPVRLTLTPMILTRRAIVAIGDQDQGNALAIEDAVDLEVVRDREDPGMK